MSAHKDSKPKYVSIATLSELFEMSENALKPKIPNEFVLKIGKSVRYDFEAIENYFKYGESKHNDIADSILNNL